MGESDELQHLKKERKKKEKRKKHFPFKSFYIFRGKVGKNVNVGYGEACDSRFRVHRNIPKTHKKLEFSC